MNQLRTIQVQIYEHNTKIWACHPLANNRYLAFWGPKNQTPAGPAIRGGQCSLITGDPWSKGQEKTRKGYSSNGQGPLSSLGESIVEKLRALLAGNSALSAEVLSAGIRVTAPLKAMPLPKTGVASASDDPKPWKF